MTKIKAKAVYANAFKTKKTKNTKLGLKFFTDFKGVALTLNAVVEPTENNVNLYEGLRTSQKDVEINFDENTIKERVVDGVTYLQVNIEATELKKLGFEALTRSESLMQDILKLSK